MSIETGAPKRFETHTTYAAREHARSQAGAHADTQPTVPASSLADPPAGVARADVLWEETLGEGGYAVRTLPVGARLRIIDLEGDTCVGAMLHRSDRTIERLCLADTVKLQWQVYPRPGYLLLSDMGRVLASIVEDDGCRHDTFCGCSLRGDLPGGDAPAASGRDLFLRGLAKVGLEERDLPTPINLFQGVRVGPDGSLTLERESARRPNACVLLRAEMPVVVTLVVLPHRLDPRPAPRAGKVRVTAWRGKRAATDDPVRRASPEAARAFENTDEELALGEVIR
jgi:urea carboxylase-associated protein 2